MQNTKKVRFLAQAAVIAALYTALTFAANALNLAFNQIQFRFSEALTILPLFTPAAVPGLALGCFLSNLASPFGVADWIFGSAATLLGALGTRWLRHIRFHGVPLLSLLMPVLFNAVIIGFELACFSGTGHFSLSGFAWPVFSAAAVSVAIGEAVICYGLGIPFFFALRRADEKYPQLFA